jgi:hypothetical protein
MNDVKMPASHDTPIRFSHAIALVVLGLVAAPPARAEGEGAGMPDKATPALALEYDKRGSVFELWEMSVSFAGKLDPFDLIPDTQVHDAHDADRDGVFVRLSAEFTLNAEHRITVPGFAMKDDASGPCKWRVRWSPDRPGSWSVKVLLEWRASKAGEVTRLSRSLPEPIVAKAVDGIDGPLVAPVTGQATSYLRRMKPDGTTEATWLFGACRAWVVQSQDPNNDWHPHEWLDREKELLGPMREGGFNLLNQWMAPWEFLLVHHDRAEFWRRPDETWKRVPPPKAKAWSGHQCYDQGRAAAFDRLVKLCEGNAEKSTIHLLLAPLPHQCLQLKEHPWGAQESGWSPEDDAGKQSLERLNGFSGFKKDMAVWDFFEANPKAAPDDWRSRLFDHQANFFRYLFARWGYSRAVGVWVLVDELDAVGDEVGEMAEKRGWWAHPQCDRWLADVVRLFHGKLTRADGLRYQGDPYRHPVHAATTSFGGQAEEGGNVDWQGGPTDARPDLFGWHWYPYWPWGASWSDVWTYTVDGVMRYSQARIGKHPRLISEFGAPDRNAPADAPSSLYPNLYHFAIWAAIFSGQAGTPMDWDDGKEFGELKWRDRKGIFDQEHYPVDHVAQLKALRRFLGGLSPDDVVSSLAPGAKVKCVGDPGVRVAALYRKAKTTPIVGWLFSSNGNGTFKMTGLRRGAYIVIWYDPWRGTPLPMDKPTFVSVGDDGVGAVDAGPLLKRLSDEAAPFPKENRFAEGSDIAFKIERRISANE